MIGLALAGLLIALSVAEGFRPLCNDHYEKNWLLLPSATLALFAGAIHNPWIAGLAAWLAIHPFLLAYGVQFGLLTRRAGIADLVGQQCCAVVGFGFYLGLEGRIKPADMPWLAGGLVLWAAICAMASAENLWSVPSHFEHGGLLGNRPAVGFWVSVGSLSAAYLWQTHHAAWIAIAPVVIVCAAKLRNWSAFAAMGVALVWYLAIPWTLLLILPMVVSMVLISSRQSQSLKSRHEALCQTWGAIRKSHYFGAGLGSWINVLVRQLPEGRQYRFWTAAHNDWLQSWAELGPVPVLLALGYLGTLLWWPPAEPAMRYAASLVIFTAIYAAVYYPIRHPAQAALLLVALGSLA